MASTVVDGRPCLKLTVLDPDLRTSDVAAVLDEIRDAADRLARAGRTSATVEASA